MNFYTTYSAYSKSLDTVDSVFFEIVKTPVMSKVIEAMGDSFSVRKRRPVMVIDPNCLLRIGVPFPIELTD